MKRLTRIILLLTIAFLTILPIDKVNGIGTNALPNPGLKYYVSKIRPDFKIGVYFPEDPVANPKAAEFVTSNFNFATLGIYMKAIQPKPDQWNFRNLDAKTAFLLNSNVAVCFHHGIGWNTYNPAWLYNEQLSRGQLQGILDNRIKTILTRYQDKTWLFHVVNEAFDKDGNWRDEKYNIWMKLGWHNDRNGKWPLYLERAFRMAREYGGDKLQLIYSENNNAMLNSIKADKTLALFQDFRKAGIPIDGVGFQFHCAVKNGELREGSNGQGVKVDFDSFAQNMKRFAKSGAAIHITEFDVHLPEHPSAGDYQIQADAYREVLKKCMEESNCKSFQSWGSSDYNWGVPQAGVRPPSPNALMLDENYQPKQAYFEMLQYLKEQADKK